MSRTGSKNRKRNPDLRLSFRYRQKDKWLIDEIMEMVKVKKAMGGTSSVGYELLRLAKIGFSGEGERLLRVYDELNKKGDNDITSTSDL